MWGLNGITYGRHSALSLRVILSSMMHGLFLDPGFFFRSELFCEHFNTQLGIVEQIPLLRFYDC